MSKKYPLHQIDIIKKKRLDQAERALREKREEERVVQEKYDRAKQDRQKALEARDNKLNLLREKMDEGAPSAKIETIRVYLKIVDETFQQKHQIYETFADKLRGAQEATEAARQEVIQRQKDQEKMQEHRKQWDKEMRAFDEQEEAKLTDDMGTVRFIKDKQKKQ